MYLYITADRATLGTGGGTVTFHESQALAHMAQEANKGFLLIDRDRLSNSLVQPADPWGWDELALAAVDYQIMNGPQIELACFYSGTMTKTVRRLKEVGAKVAYTVAAHRVSDSREAFESMGFPYEFPHLTDPRQWRRYSQGYWDADLLVVPSEHSKDVVEEQWVQLNAPGGRGASVTNIRVVPHGCELPPEVSPFPKRFTVGYMGALGPDKGVRFLLEAWKRLGWRDAELVIAGKESTSDFMWWLLDRYCGGGNVRLLGWVENLADFYRQVSVYVQPSATEGFGIEVLEALAHGRPVICSDHAGAVDLVRDVGVRVGTPFKAGDVNALECLLQAAKRNWDLAQLGKQARERATGHTWENVRKAYAHHWKELLNAS